MTCGPLVMNPEPIDVPAAAIGIWWIGCVSAGSTPPDSMPTTPPASMRGTGGIGGISRNDSTLLTPLTIQLAASTTPLTPALTAATIASHTDVAVLLIPFQM